MAGPSGFGRTARTCTASVEFKSRGNVRDDYKWSVPVNLFYTYPYKLFVPHPTVKVRESTRWVYPVVYGGGIVGGDSLQLKLLCGEGSSILLTSQAFNKVYKSSRDRVCEQINQFTVEKNSLLSVLPDLMVCFADSNYTQNQRIQLKDPTAGVIYLDWFSSGRIAYRERWKFAYLRTLLEIYLEGDLILRENLVVEEIEGLSIQNRMRDFNVFGLLVICGNLPRIKNLRESISAELSKREEYGVPAESRNIFCCSLAKHGVCIVRFLCADSAAAYTQIERLLSPMFEIYGGSPFFNKY